MIVLGTFFLRDCNQVPMRFKTSCINVSTPKNIIHSDDGRIPPQGLNIKCKPKVQEVVAVAKKMIALLGLSLLAVSISLWVPQVSYADLGNTDDKGAGQTGDQAGTNDPNGQAGQTDTGAVGDSDKEEGTGGDGAGGAQGAGND
jgi:hypothetical protein